MSNLKILFFAVLFCITGALHTNAQVALAAQVPPAGIMQRSQLWNIVLTNTGRAAVIIKVAVRISDAATGQGVMTGLSRGLQLPTGTSLLHLSDFQPISAEFLSPAMDQRDEGFMTPGSYIICYSVIVEGDKSGKPASEDCIRFIVEPVSPPILNLPVDKDTLKTSLPAFSWLPPAPLHLFSDLNYDLVLVALMPGQAPAEAIQQNMPVYRSSALRQPFLNYPAGAPTLDTGINYAWMVTARNGRQYSSQTEIHTFRITGAAPVTEEDLSSFVELSREGTGGKPLQAGTILKGAYLNDSGDSVVVYEIISLGQHNKVVAHGNLTLQPGPNMISIPLEKVGRLTAGNLYAFRFRNTRNESWELKFMYQSAR